MTTTYVKHPVTGGAAEVARLVLTDRNGTPKEVSALWKDGVCLFAKKGALVKNDNEMEDIDGNDVVAWSLPSDTPIPRHTFPWESEIIPLHDEDRWYVIVPNSVVVTMGGVDITDTCYDAETHKISIPMVKGDIVVEAEATEVIQFETEMQILPSVTFLGQKEETTDEDFVDDGLAYFSTISGNTFVWNQLLEHTGSQVETISTAVYYKRINGVESVFTSEGETITAETDTDMLINLTHLYGANARNFPLDPTNANTLAQFKTFFPLEYYPYSAPRLMNLAITSITASSNGLSTVFDLDVKNITGKLNGSGDSVKVFPDGMAGAAYSDYIAKQDGVWKAIVRNRKATAKSNTGTWYTTNMLKWLMAATSASTAGLASITAKTIVSDKYISKTWVNGSNESTIPKGFISLNQNSNTTRFWFNMADFDAGIDTTVVYSLESSAHRTYVLDDAWQTILDQTFHYIKSSVLTTETNTAEPTTAPLTIAVASNIRGWKVKPICLKNWGENIIDGEITAKEAAEVTDIAPTGQNAYFMGAQMKKFNEFRYFTGLETISTSTTTLANAMGTFQGCNLLEEITLPKLAPNVTARYAVFNGCSSLTHIDLTPWGTTNFVYMSFMFYNTGLEELDLTPFSKIVLWVSAFTNSAITKLTTRGITFSPQGTPPDSFAGCTHLTTIDGGITGYRYQLDFKSCRGLTHDSAVEIINTVGSGVGGVRPLIFYATTYDTLTDEEKAVATSKNRSVLRSII